MTAIALSAAEVTTRIRVIILWAKMARKSARTYFAKAEGELFERNRATFIELAYSYQRQVDSYFACARLIKGTFQIHADKMRAARYRRANGGSIV